ncbi:MAG: PAS domain S-box protein [Mariprofundaceae bacterium]|nr:PAS domain S-box protein [Mariprofundaceae bacterium]
MSGFPWLPVRVVLPLLLLLVTGSVIGSFWWFEVQHEMRDIEQEVVANQLQDMHRLAMQLEKDIQHEDAQDMPHLLGDVGSEPGMQYALLCGPDGRIFAATRLDWRGQTLTELANGEGDAELLSLVARIKHDKRGDVHLSADRMTVWAHYPVRFPSAGKALRSQQFGALIAKFDLTYAKQAEMYRVEVWVRKVAMVMLAMALLFWLLMRHILTRRMQRIVDVARQVGQGDLSVRTGLSGGDELAHIGAAFDIMINQLDCEHKRLLQMSRAFEYLQEGVLITDADGCIEYVNEAFTRISGYGATEALGKKPNILKSGEHSPEFYQAFWNRISQGKVWKGNQINRRKDGSLYTARVSVAPLLDSHGKVTHFVGVQEDISEQQQLEEQFMQAQKMESLGTLVGGIAHDFNNMLAGMVGNLYMARKKIKDQPEVVLKLELVEKLSFRAADMIKQLLAFARKDMVEFQTIDFTPFIKEAYKLAHVVVPENVCCLPDFGNESLSLDCDATQVQQILMNLLVNARDALRNVQSPQINVQLRSIRPDEAFRNRHRDAMAQVYAELSIKDNGCGMSEAELQRIFEPFYTTKNVGEGTGLGLSMVFGAMQRHQGFIEVDSEPGCGTVFRLYFPLSAQFPEEVLPVQSDIWRASGERLLLADDEPVVRDTLSEMLSLDGFHVDVASDGAEAVRLFSAQPEAYDAVILDVVMPVMGGMQAALKIRELDPDMPIIFATGYDREHVLSGVGDMQHIAALSKPLHAHRLRQILRKWLQPETDA